MRRISIIACTALLCLGPATAQDTIDESGGPKALIDYLGLSEFQLAALRDVQASIRDAAQPVAEEARAKRQELRQAKQQDPPDTNLIGMLTMELEELAERLASIRGDFQDDAAAVLDSNQLALLGALEDALALQAEARQAAGLNLISSGEPRLASQARSRRGRKRGGRRQGSPAAAP